MKRTFIIIASIALLVALTAAWLLVESRSDNQLPPERDRASESTKNTENSGNHPVPDGDDGALSYTSPKGVTIRLDQSITGAPVTSPLIVRGMVPGTWSFEASFPVELRAADGTVLSQAPAELQDSWMTEQDVPFVVTLTFDPAAHEAGTVVFHRANASGLPENDDSITINVRFK